MDSFSLIWTDLLVEAICNGEIVSPRGHRTRELIQKTVKVDMRSPVLMVPERRLSYKFMAAEAYWILSGDDTVEGIAPFNPNIGQYSDDGKRFFGAYGPKVMQQLPYVIDKLMEDPDTRQAGLTIWRESPPKTKDVPCTVAMFFNIRDGKLNANVFMRSSDIWMGLPYDVFNFSMIGHFVCAVFNEVNSPDSGTVACIEPGDLYVTAASSHLYERNLKDATKCLTSCFKTQVDTPEILFKYPQVLMSALESLRHSSPGDAIRWWEGGKNENN